MIALLKYPALLLCILFALMSVMATLSLTVPLAAIPFLKLAMVALQILFYLLASYELIRNNFRHALIYTVATIVVYIISAFYDTGTQFFAQISPAFYQGLGVRAVIAALCYGALCLQQRRAARAVS